jgi:eukaryotic-like serine/threonine-protein kinase
VSETISREEFVRTVSESGILPEADLRAALDELGGEAGVQQLAASLVRSGRLTPFQADAAVKGPVSDLCIGNYVVLDRLGAGGMGTVFKARHRRMNRVVALKILSRETAAQSSFTQRFQREVETIAKLSHPNIVMAFDADEAEIGPFLVMEFVDGRDLGSEVEKGGPLSTADALDCILQAARGLAYAHDHGVIHRDIKPANLLRDAEGLVKVADLGLARLSSTESTGETASLTRAGGILGTADYMAPEQALDSTSVDHRADIYSLGCTLFYLLAGRSPYQAGSLMALLLKHRDAAIPSLREARPDVPAQLDEIFRRMAAKKPEDRHSTLAEAVVALEGMKATHSLSATRPAATRPSPEGGSSLDVTLAIDSIGSMESMTSRTGLPLSGEGNAPTPSDVQRVIDLSVVLVEPSRAQAGIVRKYLQKLGIEKVRLTGSGKQALELTKQEPTHVILSSMHLADMTGVQLAQALRNDQACAGVGFVLASSESDGGEANKVLDAPLTVLLPKPFDLRGLARSLAQATGRAAEEILR